MFNVIDGQKQVIEEQSEIAALRAARDECVAEIAELRGQVSTLRNDAISYDSLRDCLGEAIHTAFRKGGDSKQADAVWGLILEMPVLEWESILDWTVVSLRATFSRAVLKGDG